MADRTPIVHPRLAPLEARVCLVECFDGAYTRVFGPYPRPEAARKREDWNRRVPDLWRYEFWEDFEDTDARLQWMEPYYRREDRWHYLLGHIAYETAPAYVVRVDTSEPGPQPILETLFGPVPRKIANHAVCDGVGVLDWVAEMASKSVVAQPPPVASKDAAVVWTTEWRLGTQSGFDHPKDSDLPSEADWPSWPGLEAEPELFRCPTG